MKTEAEILQIYKDHAAAKKLSVSEITMQKRAASLAQLAIEDEAIFNSLVEADKNFLEVANENIRFERAQQRKVDAEEFAKKTPKQTPPKVGETTEEDGSNEILTYLQEMKKEIETLKEREVVSQKRTAIEKTLYSKGVDKSDKEIISKLLALQPISKDTEDDKVVDVIIDAYNTIKSVRPIDTQLEERFGNDIDSLIKSKAEEINKLIN